MDQKSFTAASTAAGGVVGDDIFGFYFDVLVVVLKAARTNSSRFLVGTRSFGLSADTVLPRRDVATSSAFLSLVLSFASFVAFAAISKQRIVFLVSGAGTAMSFLFLRDFTAAASNTADGLAES